VAEASHGSSFLGSGLKSLLAKEQVTQFFESKHGKFVGGVEEKCLIKGNAGLLAIRGAGWTFFP
jgi:hypothetical protein